MWKLRLREAHHLPKLGSEGMVFIRPGDLTMLSAWGPAPWQSQFRTSQPRASLGNSCTAKIESHKLRACPINPAVIPQPRRFFLWLWPERACLCGFCFNSCRISMFPELLLAAYLSPVVNFCHVSPPLPGVSPLEPHSMRLFHAHSLLAPKREGISAEA